MGGSDVTGGVAVLGQTKNLVIIVGATLGIVAVLLAYVLINPGIFKPPGPGVGIETGQVAPAFVIQDVNGTAWNLSAHRGEVVLLDFMGVNCSTCAVEMSEGTMQAVHDAHVSHGFTILSIDIGGSLGTEDPVLAWRFLRGLNTDGTPRWAPGNWTIALDNQGLATTFRASALPLAYLLDGSGTIVWKHLGYVTHAELEAQVVAVLA